MARILIAEDDPSMRGFLALALEKAGHEVAVARDGLAALRILEGEAGEAGAPFDLLLTDIVMPGMDGIELSQKALKTRPGLKIMFITGFAAVAAGREDLSAPGSRMLAKPFHLGELVAQVEALLGA